MDSRYSCMVWYDAGVAAYVAMSPEWGAEAVGIGACRTSAVEHLEALFGQLEQQSEQQSERAGRDGDHAALPTPADLSAVMDRESARLRAASVGEGPDVCRPRRLRTGT